MVGHSGCIAYSPLHVVYVSTKHIAYFFLLSFVVFSFFLFICRCTVALSRLPQVSILGDSRRHRLLKAFIYVFMSFMLFHIMLYCDTCLSLFREHMYFDYVFDNGCVHFLLVGSEPIHCSYYLFLCICRLQISLSYPWWGWTSIFAYCC